MENVYTFCQNMNLFYTYLKVLEQMFVFIFTNFHLTQLHYIILITKSQYIFLKNFYVTS